MQSLVSDGQSTTTYAYDSFDQLVRENNQAAGKTWTYAYDDGGNIQSKTEYAYTTGSLGAAVRTVAYGYGDASWSDLLTSIGGQSLTTDALGNLLSDGTWVYTWQHGRQLAGMSKSGTNIAYRYDADGLRIAKTVNGTTYNYFYLGDQLVELTWGSNKLHFTYDSTGPLSVNYNGTKYFYVKNAQGDVTGLVSTGGTRVVSYTYDAWGNPLTTTGSMATTLGAQNPLRYRGYVYDTETGLYYLQSRYYNPSWGRFINADSQLNDDLVGCNMFAYCSNNPVIRTDNAGQGWWVIAGAIVGGAIGGAAKIASNLVRGEKWSTGVLGAVAGGATYGAIVAGTGNIAAAAFASSAVESMVNQATSYSPKLAKKNNMTAKSPTRKNIGASARIVFAETITNGATTIATAMVAGKIIPTNPGWFKPQKLAACFFGKYAILSETQSAVQGVLNIGMDLFKQYFGLGFEDEQEPVISVFPTPGVNTER